LYTLYIRIAETATAYASDAASASFTTSLKPWGATTVSITGIQRYLQPLNISIEDLPSYITPGEITCTWYKNGAFFGEGTSFTPGENDIGSVFHVTLSGSGIQGSIRSADTSPIGKALITNYTAPTSTPIQYPQQLGESVLTGGSVPGIPGTWSWVNPSLQPTFAQNGALFDAVFTPSGASAALYEPLTVKVQLAVIMAEYEPQTFLLQNGLIIDGLFMDGVTVTATLSNTAASLPYLSLLKASAKDAFNGPVLILPYLINIALGTETSGELYKDTLTVSCLISKQYANREVSVWFFAGGKAVNYIGAVDADGFLLVEGVIL